jgi:hypothetical protein
VGNIEKVLEADNMSEHSQGADAVEGLKMAKQCGNVYENKGSRFENVGLA